MTTTTQIPENIKALIAEYKADPNCRPYDWISGEKLTDHEKKLFIAGCQNRSVAGMY